MPNIIEQQDLLKGLPDNRLALLMQKPDASIPPFLVAAEAQRRQAIRQQFAGDNTKESVVDTLTKQIANVPQNVKAPPQTPPNIPPPPMQAGGIGALAPQAPQRMAGGGAALASQKAQAARPWDYNLLPRVYDYVSPGFNKLIENMQKFGVNPTNKQRQEMQDGNVEPAAPETSIDMTQSYPDISKMLPDKKIPKMNATEPRKEDAGTNDTSTENKYKAEEAKFRKRIEDMYAADEPSNWENAQKWFAMSQAIMQPDQNIVQGLASAGGIYAQSMADQAAAERAAKAAQDEMLLKYDMGIYQQDRQAQIDAAAKADDRAWELQKANMFTAKDKANILKDQLSALAKTYGETIEPTAKAALEAQMKALQTQLDALMNSNVPSEDVDRDKLDTELVSSIFGR